MVAANAGKPTRQVAALQEFRTTSGDHSAQAEAIELVGQANFGAASADLWIARYLQSSGSTAT